MPILLWAMCVCFVFRLPVLGFGIAIVLTTRLIDLGLYIND